MRKDQIEVKKITPALGEEKEHNRPSTSSEACKHPKDDNRTKA